MTTKPKSVEATAAPEAPTVAAPEAPSVNKKPFAINVAAPCHLAFAESVAHARNGYCFSEAPIAIQPNGWAFFQMILGNPDVHAIQAAKESTNLSIEQEQAQFRKAVAEEAKRLLEQQKKDELERQVAAIKAEQARQIRALEAATEAAIAKL